MRIGANVAVLTRRVLERPTMAPRYLVMDISFTIAVLLIVFVIAT